NRQHRLRQPSTCLYSWSISTMHARELRLSIHTTKVVSIIAVLLILVTNALELLPVATPFQPYLAGGALALGLVATDSDPGRARPGTRNPGCRRSSPSGACSAWRKL